MGSKARHLTKLARGYFGKRVRVVQAHKRFKLVMAGTAFDLGKRVRATAATVIRNAGEMAHAADLDAAELCCTFIRGKLTESSYMDLFMGTKPTPEQAARRKAYEDDVAAQAARERVAYRKALAYLAVWNEL